MSIDRRTVVLLLLPVLCGLSACSGPKKLAVEGVFPIPLMQKAPVSLGIYLDETLVQYEHKETIDKKGSWEVAIGPSQQALFDNLASGVFEAHTFVSAQTIDGAWDGVLKPSIEEVQFSLPDQTRSNYYEVWIRYKFMLFDREGGLIGEWNLPAYGKASNKNYGSSTAGLQAASMAACRDAMAFFSINFSREPVVRKWLAAGKPLAPPTQTGTAQSGATQSGATQSGTTQSGTTQSGTAQPAAAQPAQPGASDDSTTGNEGNSA